MKFEISRHKLRSVVYKYLDTFYGDLVAKEPKYYDGIIFTKDDNQVRFLIYKDDSLLINKEIFEDINNIFPLTEDELGKIISTWFINKEEVVIRYVHLYPSGSYDMWVIEDDNDDGGE